jgi:hypothetical protein
MKYLLILCLFISGCASMETDRWTATPLDHSRTASLVAKYNNLSTIVVVPNGPQIGDKCPECNDPPGQCGVGSVGDGTVCVKCENCGGDGKIDEKDLNPQMKEEVFIPLKKENKEVVQKPQLTNEIFYYSRPGCSWCVKWENEVKQKLINSGWKVTPKLDLENPVPHFKMIISGVEKTHTGYMSVPQFTQYYNSVVKKK